MGLPVLGADWIRRELADQRLQGTNCTSTLPGCVHVAPISDVVTGGHWILPNDPCIF